MEGRFCVLSDTEDFQTLLSNNATNLRFERYDSLYPKSYNVSSWQCMVVNISFGVASHLGLKTRILINRGSSPKTMKPKVHVHNSPFCNPLLSHANVSHQVQDAVWGNPCLHQQQRGGPLLLEARPAMGWCLHHQGRAQSPITHAPVRQNPPDQHLHHRWLPHDPVRHPAGQPVLSQRAVGLPGQTLCGAFPPPDGLLRLHHGEDAVDLGENVQEAVPLCDPPRSARDRPVWQWAPELHREPGEPHGHHPRKPVHRLELSGPLSGGHGNNSHHQVFCNPSVLFVSLQQPSNCVYLHHDKALFKINYVYVRHKIQISFFNHKFVIQS